MWFLISERRKSNGESQRYGLLTDKQYSVGRRDSDILILNDPSISRQHALLEVSYAENSLENPEVLPTLTVKDSNSKFGTFINSTTRVTSQKSLLSDGNTLTFGQCGSTFRVSYNPLTITTSCVDSTEKSSLRSDILKLGGHLVSEWRPNCTHLVMKGIKVTIKAVCAMVSLKPIVTPQYFTDLKNRWESQADLPNSAMYIPPILEECIDHEQVSFNVLPERKTVFQGKTFFFLTTEQYKKMNLIISLAGGNAVLLKDDQEVTEEVLLNPNNCVMRSSSKSSSASQNQVSLIENVLKRNKKRMIPESDIGLAVVFCSTEKYCNPSFDVASSLFGGGNKLISQTYSQQEVYAPETQMSHSSQDRSLSVQNPSLPSCVGESIENKQPPLPVAGTVLNLQKVNLPSQIIEQQAEPRLHSKPIKRERDPDLDTHETKHMKLEEVEPQRPEVPVVLDTVPVSIKKERPSPPPSVNEEMSLNDDQPPQPRTSVNGSLPQVNDYQCSPQHIATSAVEDPNPEKTTHKKNHSSPKLENQSFIDDDLPRNLLLVEFASLLFKKSAPLNKQITLKQGVRNFKKFRKANLGKNNFLPHIIGGRDLEVYVKNSTKAIDDWLNEHPELQTQEEEESGAIFDWDTPSRNKGKKRRR